MPARVRRFWIAPRRSPDRGLISRLFLDLAQAACAKPTLCRQREFATPAAGPKDHHSTTDSPDRLTRQPRCRSNELTFRATQRFSPASTWTRLRQRVGSRRRRAFYRRSRARYRDWRTAPAGFVDRALESGKRGERAKPLTINRAVPPNRPCRTSGRIGPAIAATPVSPALAVKRLNAAHLTVSTGSLEIPGAPSGG
jgi:hypothetical protein